MKPVQSITSLPFRTPFVLGGPIVSRQRRPLAPGQELEFDGAGFGVPPATVPSFELREKRALDPILGFNVWTVRDAFCHDSTHGGCWNTVLARVQFETAASEPLNRLHVDTGPAHVREMLHG